VNEDISLKDTLKEIHSKIDELSGKKEIKKWNVPFFSRLTPARAKRNWVLICYIQENKGVSFVKAQIDEGVILINGIPHTVSSDEILFYRKLPFIIVPSWSIKPFSAHQNLQNTKDAGNSTLGWEYIMNYLKKTEIKSVKNAGMIMWVMLGLVILGGGYYFIKNGGF
jgi:hypothetical protein